jgi:flavodoxin
VQKPTQMSVLVGYASEHGATGEIAERIAEILTLAGRHGQARPVQRASDLCGRAEGLGGILPTWAAACVR